MRFSLPPARAVWLLGSLLLLASAVALAVATGPGALLPLLAAGIAPDLALIGAFAGGGRLRPERVRGYNRLHHPAPAVALFAVGASLTLVTRDGWALAALAAGLGWTTHIAVDRAAGYGLRAADGSIVPVGRRPAAVR